MAQHDYVIANGTGAATRADLNNGLAAIVSNNSGATEPATMYAYQWWADTTTGLLKIRNAANSAWVTVGTLASANLGLAALASPTFTGTVTAPTFTASTAVNIPLGSAGSPTLFFTGDTNTGLFSPGADAIALATAGTNRLHITSAGNVGIGTTAPGAFLEVSAGNRAGSGQGGSITVGGDVDSTGITNNTRKVGFINVPHYANATGKMALIFGDSQASENIINIGGSQSNYTAATSIAFYTAANNTTTIGTERGRWDSSGRFLVGTSTARANFFNTSASAAFQIEAGATNTGASIVSGPASSSGSYFILAKQRSGSVGGNTIVQSDDEIGTLQFQGSDGTEFVSAASITAWVDGTPGANDMPGRLVFSTTADGASSPTERMRINQKGEAKFSTTGSYPSATTGGHQFRTAENLPTLTVDNAITSGFTDTVAQISLGYDANATNSNYIYCNSGGTQRLGVRTNGGIANYSANNVNLSDRNAKKDIAPAADTWDCLKEWEIVNFRYKDQGDDADLNMGVIAQQVAESCPEVITVFQKATENQPEKLGVKDQQMMWMAIKALQEAQVRIETLEAEVAALKAS